jgi:hypothetical protein
MILCRNGAHVDQQLKSAIEGTVIKWVTQANRLLEQESGEAIGAEKHPGPTAGLFFCSQLTTCPLHCSLS